jgi:hypothetical protein
LYTFLAKPPADFHTTHTRETKIEKQQIVRVVQGKLQPLFARVHYVHSVGIFAKCPSEEARNLPFIFNDEDAHDEFIIGPEGLLVLHRNVEEKSRPEAILATIHAFRER